MTDWLFRTPSLKKKLIRTHLSVAMIGAILLIVSLGVIIWLKENVNSHFKINVPLEKTTKNIQTNLQTSLASLRGWISIKNDKFIKQRHAAWYQNILPDLKKLETLINKTHNQQLQQLVDQIKIKLLDLKMWQWRIEDVAQTPGNFKTRIFVKRTLDPASINLISYTSALIAQGENITAHDEKKLTHPLSEFRNYFAKSKSQLIEYILTNNKFDLTDSNKNLEIAQQELTQIKNLISSMTEQQQSTFLTLNKKFYNYKKLLKQLIDIQKNNSQNLAVYWLSQKAIPLAEQSHQLLNKIETRISTSEANEIAKIQTLAAIISYVIGFFIILLMITSWYLADFNAKVLLKPINLLLNATKELASGKLNTDIEILSQDEFGELTKSFNTMRQQRQLAEKKITAIIETAIDSIITINTKGIILSCNSATKKLFGYTDKELIGHNVSKLMPEPHRSEHDQYLKNYLTTGKKKIIGISRELEAQAKSGKLIPILLSVSEIKINNEQIFTGMIHDLTEEKRQQKHNKEVSEQIQNLQKLESIGVLAGGIAHDFNNILFAINGFAQLQKKKLVSAKMDHELMNRITKNISRAADLTNQLITFAKHDTTLELKNTDINFCIAEAIELLRPIAQKNITIKFLPTKNLPCAYANETQLIQAFQNLGINAIHAMPDGGELYFSSKILHNRNGDSLPNLDDGDYINILVKDNGTGIPKSVLPRIFEPFFSTKEVGKGTGLGLSTIYGIISNHNGTIEVNSEPDVGTTFNIYIPAIDKPTTQ